MTVFLNAEEINFDQVIRCESNSKPKIIKPRSMKSIELIIVTLLRCFRKNFIQQPYHNN